MNINDMSDDGFDLIGGFILTTVDKLADNVDGWEDLYRALGASASDLHQIAGKGGAASIVKTPDVVVGAVIGTSFLRGYFEFRMSQPTMTDFELAKISIFERTRAHVTETLSGAHKLFVDVRDGRKPMPSIMED